MDGGANNTSFDYSNSNIENCFLTAFEAYVRNDLNYKNDGLYYVAWKCAAVVGRIQHGDQSRNRFRQEPAHEVVRGHGST